MSGPLPGLLAPLTGPASWLYRLAVAARNARFDRGRGVESVDVPVISVGNITAGGAGKSPMVGWIGSWLIAEGRVPIVAMRGYGTSPGEPSDEHREHIERRPDIGVVADPDRVEALRAFLPRHPAVDCVILDDGFQHRRLHRDLDLVLVDATRSTLDDRLLPRGYLREPLACLARADAVVVTRAAAVDGQLAERIELYHGRPPIAWSRHVWTRLAIVESNGEPEYVEVEWLRGKRVLTLLGVGNPQSIIDQLEQAGATVSANIPARDHQRYEPAIVTVARSLCDGVEALVMTAKDWVKARRLIDPGSWPVPIVVPWLEIDVYEGGEALKDLVRGAVRSPRPEA